jgi:hypothetical protein
MKKKLERTLKIIRSWRKKYPNSISGQSWEKCLTCMLDDTFEISEVSKFTLT